MLRFFIIFLLAGNLWTLPANDGPTGLICNLLVRPELTVITTSEPQFGWVIPAGKANEKQTAYRILVATTLAKLNGNEGDAWDSGLTVSSQSQHVHYKGAALKPRSTYYWKVAFRNGKGEVSAFSKPQQFNTGEFGRTPAWPGESRWVKLDSNGETLWAFEDRNPIRYHTIYPRKTIQKENGTWFIDFGRSAFSYATFQIYYPESETGQATAKEITVRIGEKAIGDSIDRVPGAGVLCKEYPLTIRPGIHEYTLEIPRFVSRYPHSQVMPEHMREVIPFRYCELDCEDKSIMLLSTSQSALHTAFDENASSFTSSSQMLNDIYNLCRYSIKVNTFNGDYAASQRERMMYEADSYIHQMGHYAVDREFSVARYSLKNMIFHATWPTEWISLCLMMAWADYLHTGNTDVIQTLYDDLRPKTLIGLRTGNELISTRTGLKTKEFLETVHYGGNELRDIVDWPQNSVSNALKGGETDAFEYMDYNSVVNAYHYHTLQLMAKMASAVGKKQDATYFAAQAVKVKKAFNRYFFDPSRGIYVDGIGTEHAALHGNLYALAFGLVPDSAKETVIAYIRSKGMACGVYSANFLLEALFDSGEAEYALSLLTSTTDRSWYNMIRIGSTMTIEAWDNKYKTNNGWSHAWSSSPAHILPRKLIGIEPETPGFEVFRIKPAISSLKEAEATLPTIRGEIKAAFVNEAGSFKLSVTIPGNTVAQIYLPAKGKVTEALINGIPQKRFKVKDGYILFENIPSGQYQFELSMN